MTKQPKAFLSERSFPGYRGFFSFLAKEHSSSHGVIFRGQCDPSWTLLSTLARQARDNVSELHNRKRTAAESRKRWGGLRAREAFAERFPTVAGADLHLTDEQLWAMMQHHSGRTPMLDWTRSPFVAAFFAYADLALNCKFNERPESIAIWALDTGAAHSITSQAKAGDYRYVEASFRDNRRIIAQQGCFTYLDRDEDLAAFLGRHYDAWDEAGDTSVMSKFLVNAKNYRSALSLLNRMNISYATMFPDMHGAALQATLNALFSSYEGRNPGDGPLIREAD